MLRESRTFITLNENGRRRRISKYSAVLKQLVNKAMSGNMPAARIYLGRLQMALEKIALREAAQSSDPEKYTDLMTLTDEELMRMVAGGLRDTE